MQDRLAYAIRQAMARRGIKSARELARLMGRDPTTVNRWTTGQSVPSALVVKPLAAALGVKVEYLVDPPAVPEYPIDSYLISEEEVRDQQELAARAAASARARIEAAAEARPDAADTRVAKPRKRSA